MILKEVIDIDKREMTGKVSHLSTVKSYFFACLEKIYLVISNSFSLPESVIVIYIHYTAETLKGRRWSLVSNFSRQPRADFFTSMAQHHMPVNESKRFPLQKVLGHSPRRWRRGFSSNTHVCKVPKIFRRQIRQGKQYLVNLSPSLHFFFFLPLLFLRAGH